MNNTVVFKGKGLRVGFLFALTEIHANDPNHTKYIIKPPKFWQLDARHELRIQNMSPKDFESARVEFFKTDPSITWEIF
jgi:hypothetical protein